MRMGFVEGIDRLGRLIWEVFKFKASDGCGEMEGGVQFWDLIKVVELFIPCEA